MDLEEIWRLILKVGIASIVIMIIVVVFYILAVLALFRSLWGG